MRYFIILAALIIISAEARAADFGTLSYSGLIADISIKPTAEDIAFAEKVERRKSSRDYIEGLCDGITAYQRELDAAHGRIPPESTEVSQLIITGDHKEVTVDCKP